MAGVSNQASEYFAELVRRSSRRIERLPIIKCVEETLSRRLRLGDLTLRCLAGQSNARRTKERGGRARAGAHGLSRRDHRPAGLLGLRDEILPSEMAPAALLSAMIATV